MDQDKWEVDSDEEVGTFFYAISDEKYFGGDIDNPVSMGGEENNEVKYQSGKFVPLSKYKIDAMKNYQLCADILQREIN